MHRIFSVLHVQACSVLYVDMFRVMVYLKQKLCFKQTMVVCRVFSLLHIKACSVLYVDVCRFFADFSTRHVACELWVESRKMRYIYSLRCACGSLFHEAYVMCVEYMLFMCRIQRVCCVQNLDTHVIRRVFYKTKMIFLTLLDKRLYIYISTYNLLICIFLILLISGIQFN